MTLWRHYNSIWIILNDLIIGLAFRQFLCQNRDALNAMVADGLEVWEMRILFPAFSHSLTEHSRCSCATGVIVVG